MSDAEKDKDDVTCFAVDGVVAEMVIEVEENQKIGSEDLPISPSKDNPCDKKIDSVNDSNDSVNDSKNSLDDLKGSLNDSKDSVNDSKDSLNDTKDSDGAVEKEMEKEVVELDTEKEDQENFVEIIETEDKIDEYMEDEIFEEKNDDISEDEKCDEVVNTGEKKSEGIEDQNTDHPKSGDINRQNMKNKHNIKRKRKHIEATVNGNESDSKESDMPRYPGRKRLANKRYISEDMITPKRKISESVDFKDSSKEVKRQKSEVKSKEKEELNDISDDSSSKKSIQRAEQGENNVKESDSPKESEKVDLNRPLRNRKTDTDSEKSSTKQNVLRKLPFRKNKDAPDVPDLQPKVFWWNGVGVGQGVKLGDIPEIKQRIEKAKSMRALYRILFFQWPSNGQDMIGEILQFNGFPFDKSSYEYSKRQSIMKIMLDQAIFHLCETLDIRKGDKQANIKNILDFLLKPYAKIDPATDPSWQPVVVLEKIELDDKFFDQSSSNFKLRRGRSFNSSKNRMEKDVKSSLVTPTRSTRRSGPKIEIVLDSDSEKTEEKSKEDVKPKTKLSTPKEANRSSVRPVGRPAKQNTSIVKGNTSASKDSKGNTTPGVKKATSASETTKAKASLPVKDEKSKSTSLVKHTKDKTVPVKKDVKSSPKELRSKTEETKTNMPDKLITKKKKFKKRKKMNATNNKTISENKEKENPQSKEDSDENDIEMIIDSGPDIDEDVQMVDSVVKKPDSDNVEKTKQTKEQVAETPAENKSKSVSMVILSDSSETESAEETKLVTASKKTSKVPMKRKGKPLRQFPKISDSIQNANFSALQRLHILLFGASDKAENLKSNILSFGGFPFLEGSDEWKQKHFLLSLLAQNNLREYLNLLCLPYASDDQPTMINKLMKFLAVPSEESLEYQKIQPIETEVVSSVLVDKSSPVAPAPKSKTETKKKVKKKEEKKVSKRPRKILMSEEEARRLEANFAREQRALAREKKLVPYTPIAQKLPQPATAAPLLNMNAYAPHSKSKAPITDPDQLNALLQTVYKRRALKAAGAVVSTPDKGQKTKLGDIENIKFLIVTSHLNDLEILHRLIYMLEASKSRIRKNILDFDGFGFNEDSPKYKHRMDYLNSLGYEASKRISFLLGLCSFNTNIPQNDLNELIMYFLMSPCKTKQSVPITQLPSDEPHIIVKSTASLDKTIYIQNASLTTPISFSANSDISKTSSDSATIQHSTPVPKTGTQKAKKTFPSSSKISPVKKVLLPPSQSPVLGSFGNKTQKMTLLNSIPAVPSFSFPKSTVPNTLTNLTLLNSGNVVLNAQKSPINSLVKIPSSPGKMQILNQGSNVAIADPAAAKIPVSLSNIPTSLTNVPTGQVLQNQILIPQIPNKNSVQMQTPLLHGSKMVVKSPTGVVGSPQEFIVQQQAPDGQQKVFKLIRLPPNHPLVANTSNKPSVQQTTPSSLLQQQLVLTSNPTLPGNLPPGIIIMKNNAGLPQLQNLQLLPNTPVKLLPLTTTSSSIPSVVSSSQSKTTLPQNEEIVSPDEKESISESGNTSLDNSMEVLSSSEDSPPTDEDLFVSIQEIILSSNFEDITLRNVIERVAAQYPNHDLTQRHNYMKECVKKIIIGT